MNDVPTQLRMRGRLINSLYTEAMLLADEARAYFDHQGREDREMLDPVERVTLSCESLRVTTRLMHVLAWLMTERAIELGQMSDEDAASASRRLGDSPPSEPNAILNLPKAAKALIASSQDLHARVRRLENEPTVEPEARIESPALRLLDRLERAF